MKIKRMIEWRVRMQREFPDDWDDEQIDFFFNESSYCMTNLIEDLYREKDEDNNLCLCSRSRVIVLPANATIDISNE